jgi:DNA-binding Lrp family transcriptional regulator
LLAGSRAVINIKELGYHSYHFFLMLQDSKSEKELVFRCKQSSMVNTLINYSGKWNYELSIMAKETEDALKHFLNTIDGLKVIDYVPTILLRTIKSTVLPGLESKKLPSLKYIRNDPSFAKQFLLSRQEYRVDNKDKEILYLLSQNCQLTLSEIGKKIKLTNDAVAYRIKKLVRGNYIIGFRPVVDYAALGKSIESILIKIHNRTPEVDEKMSQYAQSNKRIVWATALFSTWDYLVYFLHENQEEIHEFVKELKDGFSEYLISYEILFAYREYKYSYMTEEIRNSKQEVINRP